MNAQSLLIGPVGLVIAIITVVAFVAGMLLPSTAAVTAPAQSEAGMQPAGESRAILLLRAVAAMRWPLAALTVLITAYRIYSLS